MRMRAATSRRTSPLRQLPAPHVQPEVEGPLVIDHAAEILALEAAITDALDAKMATRWVVVAEIIDADGTPSLASLNSPGLPLWVRSGMLRWEADTLAGQPVWSYAEDDDE